LITNQNEHRIAPIKSTTNNKFHIRATEGPNGSQYFANNHVTITTLRILLSNGILDSYSESRNVDAPLISPKPINAKAAQTGPVNRVTNPEMTNKPFQTNFIFLLLILIENNQWAKGGIKVIENLQ